jgi:poly-beta-1,6-N-acetyl-D-glucosamine N-deacetylase
VKISWITDLAAQIPPKVTFAQHLSQSDPVICWKENAVKNKSVRARMTHRLRNHMRHLGVCALAAALWVTSPNPVHAADSAAILMYHRFGENSFPSTNIRLEQFDAHIAELASGPYTVLPVTEIVAAIREGRELPDRTVGITVDDGYLSIYAEAFPRLQAAGLPFTVFISTDPVDRGFSGSMSWDQIREMRDAGVTIGAHTATHLHMPANTQARNQEDMARANARYVEELGSVPTLFAYPFGEASLAVQDLVRAQGHEAAFGQHSAPLDASSDPFYMPRFALTEAFGNMDRFRLVTNARPIPHTDISPKDPTLTVNPPLFGFTRTDMSESLSGLACYAADQGKVKVEQLGPRIEVRMNGPFSAGRARINCTALGPDNRWRWLGMLYYVHRS